MGPQGVMSPSSAPNLNGKRGIDTAVSKPFGQLFSS